MEGIKAVVFDIGATLVEGPPVAPAKQLSAIIGYPDYKKISGIIMCNDFSGSGELISRLEKELDTVFSPDARRETESLWQSQFTACEELHESSQVLRFFAGRNIKIALLSDIWRPYYEGVKRAIPDIEDLAKVRVLSFLTGRKKPEPHNFMLAAEMLDEEPSRILMVGDTYTHDIEPAIGLGFKTAWLLRRAKKESGDIIDVINGVRPRPGVAVRYLWELCSDEVLNKL